MADEPVHFREFVNWAYNEEPKELVIQGRQYRPIPYLRVRGRSAIRQYLVNYLADDHAIYYWDRNSDGVQTLRPLKSRSIATFRAIAWAVGKDERDVFRTHVRKKVASVAEFHILDEEIPVFTDGTCFYDHWLRPIDVDRETIMIVPLSAANREKLWKQSVEYVRGLLKVELPFESSSRCSRYLVDRNGVYWVGSTNTFDTAQLSKITELLRDPASDLSVLIESNPSMREFSWYRAAQPV